MEKTRCEELVLLPAKQTPARVEGEAVIFHPDSVVRLFRADQTREKNIRLCIMEGMFFWLWLGGLLACSREVKWIGVSRIREFWLGGLLACSREVNWIGVSRIIELWLLIAMGRVENGMRSWRVRWGLLTVGVRYVCILVQRM